MVLGLGHLPGQGALARSPSLGSLTSGLTRTSSLGSLSGALSRTPSTSSLTRSLKRVGSRTGLSGNKHALADSDIMEEEVGDWNYMVVDPKGIRPRDEPSYAKEAKSVGHYRFPEGAILEVDRRRKSGWTVFLGLKDSRSSGGVCSGGWVFDVSPKDTKVRMVEVEVMAGEWHYEACGFDRVPVLPRPSAASTPVRKSSKGATASLEVREVVQVTKRVRPVSGKGSYLKLSDGRGWVLDFVDGHRVLQKWSPSGDFDQSEPSTSSSDIPNSLVDRSLEGSLGPPEIGEWEYVVLDPKGLSLRSKATYDPSCKIDRRIDEGEVVVVLERRSGEGTTFLRLACPQGWVFDRQPGKDSRVRMMETKVERGSWHYCVTADQGIALRTRCSFSADTKCGKGPLKGAIIEISERVRVGETTFLQLKEGRWIFDTKAGRKVVAGPLQVQVLPSGTVATISSQKDIFLLQSPTNQKWAATKFRILQNAQVEARKILALDGLHWCFVSKPGGNIEGWTHLENLSLQEDLPSSASSLRRSGTSACPEVTTKDNASIPNLRGAGAAPCGAAFSRDQYQEALLSTFAPPPPGPIANPPPPQTSPTLLQPGRPVGYGTPTGW